MSGRLLKDGLKDIGVTVSEFSRVSEISTTTLLKIFGDEYVRETTLNKAFCALKRLKAKADGLPQPDSDPPDKAA